MLQFSILSYWNSYPYDNVVLVQGLELVIKRSGPFIMSFLICDVCIAHSRLKVLLIWPYLSKCVFWVERTLWTEAPADMLLRYHLAFHQLVWFFCQIIDLFSLSFCKIFVHFFVGLVLECLKANKFVLILNIPELFDISPGFIVIILVHWNLLLLLDMGSSTCERKSSILFLTLS